MSGKIWFLTMLITFSIVVGVALVSAQEPTPQWDESIQAVLGTAFTYQGQLKQDGEPINNICDFQFSLWGANSGGTQIGETQTKVNVTVSNGYFTIPDLDFGSSAFQGDARWLGIAVRCPAGSGSFTTLSPRQALTAAPYALYAAKASWNSLSGVPPGFADGVDNDTTYTAGAGLTLAGVQFSLNTAYTDGRYWRLGGNSLSAEGSLGASNNYALNFLVNNQRALRLEPNASSPNLIGGYSGNRVTSGVVGATIAGGGPTDPNDPTNTSNRVTDDYGTIGGGGNNRAGNHDSNTKNATYATVGGGFTNIASGNYATINGGWLNTANNDYTTVGGGRSNTVNGLYSTISGGWNNRINGYSNTVCGGEANTASGAWATVGGGHSNEVSAGGTTVGGGWNNTASGDEGTVSGGANNTASGADATIGGGWSNTASGDSGTVSGGAHNAASGAYATIGGGSDNIASADFATIAGGGPSNPNDPNTNNRVTDEYGTIGGGGFNRAGNGDSDQTNAPFATVGGGRGNTASGYAATVPGGLYNTAQGAYSFAAGRRAKAMNPGCFVLADSTDADEPCVNDNRFVFRVTNAFYIWTTTNHTSGVLLPTGGSSWSSLSDRAAKENFAALDGRDILERLVAVPIQTWNYKSQDPSIRHIGPAAQDFYDAFQVGEDDRHISMVDADGVALAAIQGLYSLSQEQAKRIEHLEAENAALQEQLDSLEARIAALEQGKGAQNADRPLALILPGAGLLLAAGLAWVAQRKAG